MIHIVVVMIMLISAIPALAHDNLPQDEDEVETTDLSAIDLPEYPTYQQHVRPILEANCLACHSDGQIAGYAPFTNVEDVMFFADDIAFQRVSPYHASLDAFLFPEHSLEERPQPFRQRDRYHHRLGRARRPIG